jgi:hypothetical protein
MSTWLGSCTCGAVLEEQDAQGRPIAAACRSYVAFANFAGPTGGGYEATAGESTVRSPDGQVTARASGAPGDIAPAWLSEPGLVCGGQAADGCYARGSADRGPDWRSDRSAAGRPTQHSAWCSAVLLVLPRCDSAAMRGSMLVVAAAVRSERKRRPGHGTWASIDLAGHSPFFAVTVRPRLASRSAARSVWLPRQAGPSGCRG